MARNYLVDDLEILILVLIKKGLCLLGLDKVKGHDFLEQVYYNYREKVNLVNTADNDLKIKLKSAFAQAKTHIQEHKESIELFTELIKDTQKRIDLLPEKNDHYERHMRRIIGCMISIAYGLLYVNREEHYPDLINKTEAIIRNISNLGEISINDLAQKVNVSVYDLEVNCEITEAMKYLNDAERLSIEFGFEDMLRISQINKAFLYNEKEDNNKGMDLLLELKENDFIQKYYYGQVLNELAFAKINLADFAGVEEILKESWNWLSENKYYDELARTCYIFALYHYKQGQLSNAYSFADIANQTKSELPYIRLLYQISFLKYVSANRQGNESEYVFFRSEYDKYKGQLERRG